MKAARVLAAVLISLAMTGCLSSEMPLQSGAAVPRHAQPDAGGGTPTLVAQLLEAHHETVGQIRVSSALRPQQRIDCN